MDAKLSRYNFWMMSLEGAIFWFAWAVLDGNTVVSVFINQTTGSLALAGFASTWRNCSCLITQLILGMYFHRVQSSARVMSRVGYMSRWVMLFMVPALLLGMWNEPAAWLFLALYGVFFLADGLISLLWLEIMVGTVQPNIRGRINGNQQIVGGALGLVASVGIRFIFGSSLPPPVQFAIIFGANGVLMIANAVVLGRIKEPPAQMQVRHPYIAPNAYFGSLWKLFRKNGAFRKVAYSRCLHTAVVLMVPMFILFGSSVCGLSVTQTASLVTFSVLGQISGGFLWGQLVSHRLSYRHVMGFSSAVNVVVMAMGLACFLLAGRVSLFAPLSVMVFLGMVNNCAHLGYTNHLFECVEPAERPHYLVLIALAMLPATFSSFLAGLIATHWGFGMVFGLGLALALCCAYIVLVRIGLRPKPAPQGA